MPLTGMAVGAGRALEDIVAERMLRQKLEAEIADRQKRAELEQATLAQRAKESEIDATQRQQQIDMQAGDRRARSNQQGVRRMLGEAITQGDGPMNPQDRRGLAALQVEAGDAPTLLNEPKPERDPIADHRAKAEIDAEFRRPESPSEKGPFVVGGNLVDSRGNVIFRGQDASAAGPSPYAQERAGRTLQSVDELIGRVNGWTTGYGSMLSALPETDARAFKGALDTLKANIAFNELTAMREASKTGGALGSVAVREMELLQAALGALDQAQSPEDLKAQLQKVKASVQQWQQAGGRPPIAPATSGPGAQQPAAAAPAKRFTITKVGG